MRKPSSLNIAAVVCLSAVLWAGQAFGVVIHPEDEDTVFPTPPSEVVGAWGSTGSAVAIAPNYIITARHVSTNTDGTPVRIAGQTYYATDTIDHDTADLRLARIVTANGAPANLTEYAELYIGDEELLFDQIVIGGVGKVRGESLISDGEVYGYRWADNPDRQVHFGVNRVDSYAPQQAMHMMQADFDGPRDVGNLPGEAIPAVVDSGGGWFAQQGETWWVLGLIRSVSNSGQESWFRDPEYPTTPDADTTLALRMSRYTDWIFPKISLSRILEGDLNLDGTVDGADAAILQSNYDSADTDLQWTDGDLTNDGRVTFADAWLLLQNYGSSTAPVPQAPEPATALLLLSAGAVLLRRRR